MGEKINKESDIGKPACIKIQCVKVSGKPVYFIGYPLSSMYEI